MKSKFIKKYELLMEDIKNINVFNEADLSKKIDKFIESLNISNILNDNENNEIDDSKVKHMSKDNLNAVISNIIMKYVHKSIEISAFKDDLNLHPEAIDYIEDLSYKYGKSYNLLLKYLTNRNKKGLDISTDKVIDLKKPFLDLGISDDFLEKIKDCTPATKGGSSIGPGEILLAMALKNGAILQAGDVGVNGKDDQSSILELKAHNGRIGGVEIIAPVFNSDLNDFFKKFKLEPLKIVSFLSLKPNDSKEMFIKTPRNEFDREKFLKEFIKFIGAHSLGKAFEDEFKIKDNWLNIKDEDSTGRIFNSVEAFDEWCKEFVRLTFKKYFKESTFKYFGYLFIGKSKDYKLKIIDAAENMGENAFDAFTFSYPSFGGNGKQRPDNVLKITGLKNK